MGGVEQFMNKFKFQFCHLVAVTRTNYLTFLRFSIFKMEIVIKLLQELN